MKKFLSLVLALVMTMSLVTVSAGATEYKDLTDKNEIKYAEAVAVMNKIGIISGYTDGSFKPTENLTRGAAAKIITYLMVGSVAGEQLGVANKPYKDVAMDNAFAPYIAYCKSTGLINGYSDGTFRPSAPLDGYSYSKMLLTAMGYKSEYAGFVGSGWQTNVASTAVSSGLYAGNDGFIGSKIVTREEACLYALNLLKSATVEYKGQTSTVTTPDGTKVEVGNMPASKVKQDNETAAHDYASRSIGNGAGLLEFCEIHYPQLKLLSGATADDFGRPANKWAYKNAVVGTYATAPNFTFTARTGKGTDKDEDYNAKALGLKGYKFAANTAGVSTVNAVLNGRTAPLGTPSTVLTDGYQISTMVELSALTGNGISVEVYVSDTDANVITNVIVVKTQLMQVNAINSSAKTVTLKRVGSDGTNDFGVNINTVKEDADGYAALSAMKADDYVLITYLMDSTGSNASVAKAVAPTVVTGKLTKVAMDGTTEIGVTVAGTAYDLTANRANSFVGLNNTGINANKKDCTLFVDAYGYAIFVKDVAASTNHMVYSNTYTTVLDGKIVNMVQGYDMKGEAVSLNVGTGVAPSLLIGHVYPYTAATTSALSADYALSTVVDADSANTSPSGGRAQKLLGAGAVMSNSYYPALNGKYFAADVNFLYVATDTNGIIEATSMAGVREIKTTSVTNAGDFTYVLNSKGDKVVTVVVIGESDNATGANVAYVADRSAYLGKIDGKDAYEYELWIDGVKNEKCVSTDNRTPGTFATFTKNETTGNYVLRAYGESTKTTSVNPSVRLAPTDIKNDKYISLANDSTATHTFASGAKFCDLTGNGYSSLQDLRVSGKTFKVAVVYNGNPNSAGVNTISALYVLQENYTVGLTYNIAASAGYKFCKTNSTTPGDWAGTMNGLTAGDTVFVKEDTASKSIIKTSAPGVVMTKVAQGAVGGDAAISSFVMPAAHVGVNAFTALATFDVTDHTATDIKFKNELSDATWAEGLTDVPVGKVVYAQAAAADKGLTGGSGVANVTPVGTIVKDGTTKNVYSFTVTAAVAAGAITEKALVNLKLAAGATNVFNDTKGLVYTVTSPVPETALQTEGSKVTLKVTVYGATADNGAKATKLTIATTGSGVATANAVQTTMNADGTKLPTVTGMATVANATPVITFTPAAAASANVDVTYTVEITIGSKDTTFALAAV